MAADYISRDKAIEALVNLTAYNSLADIKSLVESKYHYQTEWIGGIKDALEEIENISAADVVEIPQGGIGEISDGYHTFNALYEQRLILTAALAKAHKDISWKSKLHEDGEVPFGGGWFIVGFSTPEGEYTYHYELKDWDLFDCVELSRGKKWDGHTDKDVKRLLSIPSATNVAERKRGRWIVPVPGDGEPYCSECKKEALTVGAFNMHSELTDFCPNCGTRMDKDGDGE
jgi:hypothetical protein